MKVNSKRYLTAGFIVLTSILVLFCFTGCNYVEVIGQYIPEEEFDMTRITTIEKTQDDFVILLLADLQINHDKNKTDKCFNMVSELVEETNPDMIITVGDNVGARRERILQVKIVEFLDSFKIPYALTLGNHDREHMNEEDLAEIYLSGEYSLFERGPDTIKGIGNYVVNITEDDEAVYSLYMLDSNTYRRYTLKEKRESELGGKKYDYIYPSQISWYEHNVTNINVALGKNINSMAFFHIPLPEYRYFTPDKAILGENRETVCNPVVNTGMFQKMKDLGSTQAVFVGHDHVNNSLFMHEGIMLGYGLKSGRTSYYDEDLIGGIKITLTNNMSEIIIEHIYKSYSL